MPRLPKFEFKKSNKGWVINVPPSVSASGRRERLYFDTRDAARVEAQRLADKYRKHGEEAAAVSPSIAADASKAIAILAPFQNVSLATAARFYADHHDARAKAPTLALAWDQAIKKRVNHRPTTLRDYKAWKKALPASLLSMNVVDITPDLITGALDDVTSGTTRWNNGLRYLSTVLQECVAKGSLAENPARKVFRARQPERDDEVTVYTADQIKALFAACRNYDDGIDRECSVCALPFAILAFAGIRPNELERLDWGDVDVAQGVIRLGSSKTKKARRRNVRIHPTLKAWIDTVPETRRVGRITPPRWRYRSARVRREAGIDGLEMMDALRHSFGTYLLATENNLEMLKSDMGHEHIRVFLNHYHKAVTCEEAEPYWKVLPGSVSGDPAPMTDAPNASPAKPRPKPSPRKKPVRAG